MERGRRPGTKDFEHRAAVRGLFEAGLTRHQPANETKYGVMMFCLTHRLGPRPERRTTSFQYWAPALGKINGESGAPDNFSLSHFSSSGGNRHRHAIERTRRNIYSTRTFETPAPGTSPGRQACPTARWGRGFDRKYQDASTPATGPSSSRGTILNPSSRRGTARRAARRRRGNTSNSPRRGAWRPPSSRWPGAATAPTTPSSSRARRPSSSARKRSERSSSRRCPGSCWTPSTRSTSGTGRRTRRCTRRSRSYARSPRRRACHRLS